MNPKRIRKLNQAEQGSGPVLYWMDRERRVHDNWAMIAALKSAAKQEQPLIVAYAVPKKFLGSSFRNHLFMLQGLQEVEAELTKQGIPFFLLLGEPDEEIQDFVSKHKVGTVITDMSPLRVPRGWRNQLAKGLKCAFYEVDARNIVPVWQASQKQEFGAYTIRPKIHRQLEEFLEPFPKLGKNPKTWKGAKPKNDWKKAQSFVQDERGLPEIDWIQPGEKAAMKVLKEFLTKKLPGYAERRNDPNQDALSNLSPYLHYGMISAQRVALEVEHFPGPQADKDAFLEELIVRRELSDNYCFYNPNYDRFEGFPNWAQQTLNEHRDDKREYHYSLKQFEKAETHDPLWNACQLQMVKTGKMHGYLRMYWGKKILEWTKTPEDAQKIAITLNDKYELDGRDSNGYVGVAWSIGGVHDRAWFEREIFGKIRYMNFNGCKRKFDVKGYVEKWGNEP